MSKPRYAISISLNEEQWGESIKVLLNKNISNVEVYMIGIRSIKDNTDGDKKLS